ncbi:MAG: tetratricopeptide repeat protein [Smithella sp.]|jgi:tetratricopeptide (TPR) repeat protein
MLNKVSIRPQRQKLIVYIILAVVTLAVYWQVNQYGYVNFDDHVYVLENIHIQSGITFDGFRWAFSTKFFGLWNPLVWLSFMFDYQLHGLNAGGYHLTNLILHILSALLLFWLFNRMTGAVWRSAFVAAFFALHPLHVESVAWISERKDVLSAFFWMLTLCLYVYYTEKPVIKRYLPVLFSFVLALLSKPMVVTLPFVMILLDYWPLNRLQSREIAAKEPENISVAANKGKKKNKENKVALKKNISSADSRKLPETGIAGIIPLWQLWEKIPFLILSTILVIITLYIPEDQKTSLKALSLSSRLANAPVAFVTYLAKTFMPSDMAYYYPFSDQLPVWHVFGAALVIIVISAAVIVTAKRLPYLFVGWLWYATTILPVIGIIQVSLVMPYSMADRYHYLPSIGLAVMLAWGIPLLINSEDIRKKILFPASIAALSIMAVLTWRQCGYWRDSASLFSHALQVTKDNYLAHNSLGSALFKNGKIEEAMYHYNEAIRLNPDGADFYNNRGICYFGLDKPQSAVEDYNKAIILNPNFADAYYNRGVAYVKLGRQKSAFDDFNEAIRLKPDSADAYNNRAIISLNQGNIETGCHDAQKSCLLGDCKLLEAAKGRGYCLKR